jgi:WD40 repeat protein
MEFLQKLAIALETEPIPSDVAHWLDDHRAIRLHVENVVQCAQLVPASQSLKSLRQWQQQCLKTPPVLIEKDELLDLTDIASSHTVMYPPRTNLVAFKLSCLVQKMRYRDHERFLEFEPPIGDKDIVEDWLRKWAVAVQGSNVFFMDWWGSGKTTELLRLCDYLVTQWKAEPQLRVPLYVDLKNYTSPKISVDLIPNCLEQLLTAELKRRNLTISTASLMQAIRDGRCILILDHVDSLASYRKHVWEWAQQLPLLATDGHTKTAHILHASTREWFDSCKSAENVLRCLRAADPDKDGKLIHLAIDASVHNRDDDLEWLAAAGLSLTDNDARKVVWSTFRETHHRTLPAAFSAIRHLLEAPSEAAQSDLRQLARSEGYAIWQNFVLPKDLAIDRPTLLQFNITFSMIEAAVRAKTDSDSYILPDLYAKLIRDQWPDADTAQLHRLRMFLRVAFGLRVGYDDKNFFTSVNNSLAHVFYLDLKDGHSSETLILLMEQPNRHALINSIARFWQECGHAQPWDIAKIMLLEKQTPALSGALFLLGLEMARVYSKGLDELTKRIEQTLPVPLSKAQLVGADLAGGNFAYLVFDGLDLSYANLTKAYCQKTGFKQVQLDHAVADYVNFKEATFENVSADGLSAKNSNWIHTKWDRQWPENVNFDGAVFDVSEHTPKTKPHEFKLVASTLVPASLLIRFVCASSDGKWIAAAGDEPMIALWNTKNLSLRWHIALPPGKLGEVFSLCFSSDNQRIYSSHADGNVFCWGVESGRQLEQRSNSNFLVRLIMPMASNRSLFFCNFMGRGAIECITDTLPMTRITYWLANGIDQRRAGMAMSAASELAYFYTRSKHTGSYVYADAAKKPRRNVLWAINEVWSIKIATDRVHQYEWLACVEEDAIVVGNPEHDQYTWRFQCEESVRHSEVYLDSPHPSTRKPYRDMPKVTRRQNLSEFGAMDIDATVAQLEFSPDGRWLVCCAAHITARIYDLHTGQEHSLDEAMDCRSMIFSSDGQYLIGGGTVLRKYQLPNLI